MKNDETKGEYAKTPSDLPRGSPTVVTNKQRNRSKSPNNKSPNEKRKWSMLRYWQQARWPKRLKWLGEGLLVVAAIGGVIVYVSDHIQRGAQFTEEHRPIISLLIVQQTPRTDGGMEYSVLLQNSGTAEAHEFLGKCEPFMNGKYPSGMQDKSIPKKPLTIGPGRQFSICEIGLTADYYQAMIHGRTTFQIFPHATYSEGQFCEKVQYSFDLQKFLDLGGCDLDKPFPQ